jgi:hypothetical protein
VWLADAELDLSGFPGPAGVSFAAEASVEGSGVLTVEIRSGGLAEEVGSVVRASASQAGPFVGFIAGANVAGVDPSQGKILLHLSASVTSGSAEVRNIVLTLSDE